MQRMFSSEGCADAMVRAGEYAAGENAIDNDIIQQQREEIGQLRRALSLVMVGGNHLASVLIDKLGPGFSGKYPPDLDADSALRMLCATTEYDVWCCWASIMRARMISEETKRFNEPGLSEPIEQ